MRDEEKTKEQVIEEVANLRAQLEEQSRRSEERFRLFFEKAPEYCYMISPEGVLLDMNNAALSCLGYEKEEILGKSVRVIYAPESLPKMEQLLGEWRRTGELRDEEMVIITKEGNRRTVLLSAGVVKDRDGEVLHSVSVQRDITERKWMEEALRESEEQYRNLFERVPMGLYRTAPEGEILDANPALVEMLGYPDRETLLAANVIDGYVHRYIDKVCAVCRAQVCAERHQLGFVRRSKRCYLV